jgi:hypothetical protein
MADTKISALPASTTPLAGTEVLPIVQSGATKQVSVANLTAGRALSATELTLTTGNLIVSSGKGIDFSATPGTGTSELLNDYEEGTFTPVLKFSGATTGITYSTQTGKYTKVGRLVTAYLQIALSSKGSASGSAEIYGLPVALPTSGLGVPVSVWAFQLSSLDSFNFHAEGTTDRIAFQQISTLGAVTYLNDTNFTNSTVIEISITYMV